MCDANANKPGFGVTLGPAVLHIALTNANTAPASTRAHIDDIARPAAHLSGTAGLITAGPFFPPEPLAHCDMKVPGLDQSVLIVIGVRE